MDFGRKNKVHVEPAMSALSDIIFMLLIFFIIASTLAVNGEAVNLPKTSTGTPSIGSTTITVTKELIYSLNNEVIAKDQLKDRLQNYFFGRPEDKRTVILNVDRDVPTGETIELFSTLKVLHCEPVIATKPIE
jgi:biopolymer transport protein ExbD